MRTPSLPGHAASAGMPSESHLAGPSATASLAAENSIGGGGSTETRKRPSSRGLDEDEHASKIERRCDDEIAAFSQAHHVPPTPSSTPGVTTVVQSGSHSAPQQQHMHAGNSAGNSYGDDYMDLSGAYFSSTSVAAAHARRLRLDAARRRQMEQTMARQAAENAAAASSQQPTATQAGGAGAVPSPSSCPLSGPARLGGEGGQSDGGVRHIPVQQAHSQVGREGAREGEEDVDPSGEEEDDEGEVEGEESGMSEIEEEGDDGQWEDMDEEAGIVIIVCGWCPCERVRANPIGRSPIEELGLRASLVRKGAFLRFLLTKIA